MERINKYIAGTGLCSRRKAEELIIAGKIKLNGKVVTELGTKVDPEKDKIEYNGKIIKAEEDNVYILLNKPIGYLCTSSDDRERKTVMDLVKVKERVVPVGRLDMNTSGMIILSNDGEFINKVTHPKNEISKTYLVGLKYEISDNEIESIKNGIEINGASESKWNKEQEYKPYLAKPESIKRIDENTVEITIHEGKNREVRKIFEALGKKVLKLQRIQIGKLRLGDLKSGKWRYLTEKELSDII